MTRRLAAALAVARLFELGRVVPPPSAEFSGDIFRHGAHQFSQLCTVWFVKRSHDQRISPELSANLNFLATPCSHSKFLKLAHQLFGWDFVALQ